MSTYLLTFTLLRDGTFGSGDGVAGLVDREVAYDDLGLPYLRGRTLKGMLSEEADNLLYLPHLARAVWLTARQELFGFSERHASQKGVVHFGRAQLPGPVRKTVRLSLSSKENTLHPQDILAAMTGLRRQTAVSPNGIPRDGSLRTMRVVLRQTPFVAHLRCRRSLTTHEEALLVATVLAWRRAGTGRNRGRGHLQVNDLYKEDQTILHSGYQTFINLLREVD